MVPIKTFIFNIQRIVLRASSSRKYFWCLIISIIYLIRISRSHNMQTILYYILLLAVLKSMDQCILYCSMYTPVMSRIITNSWHIGTLQYTYTNKYTHTHVYVIRALIRCIRTKHILCIYNIHRHVYIHSSVQKILCS